MEELKELLQFLQIGARQDLKIVATQHVLELTGSKEGLELIKQQPDIILSLLRLTYDKNVTVGNPILSLVNLSACEDGATCLLNLNIEPEKSLLLKSPDNIVKRCLDFILNPDSDYADASCMILSNLTRPSALIEKVVDFILNSGVEWDEIVSVFTKNNYNKKGANLHYLGPMFSNLTQSNRVRKYILDREKCVIQRFLPFTEYSGSIIRRGGIVGTLKNCCFEDDSHEWLLSPAVDILPRLLLPLAGGEEFDDEDNDKLPSELQYLDDDKKREIDPDIRIMLLESITQLCSSKKNREFIRNKNTYVILRELHKWEKDKKALLACENLVDILIRTEEEINTDNLKSLEVTDEMKEKFEKMDEEFLKSE